MKKILISTFAVAGLIGLGLGSMAIAQQGPGPFGDRHAEHRAERLEMLDTNNNGQIERTEIEAKRSANFAAADTNRDGGLTMVEMDAFHEAKKAERKARRFARIDTNGDGVLSIEEFPAHGLERFDRMDANDDGVISEEERASAMENRRGGRGHGHRGKHRRGGQ